jgi:hypothetical protein
VFYRARGQELDRTVTIKTPRTGNLIDAQDADRFLGKAHSVAQLRYSPIVRIHEGGHSENLFDPCCRCNAARRDRTGFLNPTEVRLARHLEISADGTIRGRTLAGSDRIRVCQPDRANRTEFRRGLFEVLRALNQLPEETRQKLPGRCSCRALILHFGWLFAVSSSCRSGLVVIMY